MNSSIMKSVGQTKSPTYGVNGVSDAKPSKNASIMSNKWTRSDRCGYGVNGVDGAGGGSGPKRSTRRSAGVGASGL